MDYGTAKQQGEPLGSGAMESTCRPYQRRFKRPGQFGSQRGNEALRCLETFQRNERWHLPFPHPANPSKNGPAPHKAQSNRNIIRLDLPESMRRISPQIPPSIIYVVNVMH
jgi:hypothetical protein